MDNNLFNIALKIRHPTLDPAEISRELAIEPETGWKAGETHPRGARKESVWIGLVPFERLFGVVPSSLSTAVALAAGLLRKKSSLWHAIEEGGQAEVIVYLSSRDSVDVQLSAEALSLLDGLSLTIALNVDADQVAVA